MIEHFPPSKMCRQIEEHTLNNRARTWERGREKKSRNYLKCFIKETV